MHAYIVPFARIKHYIKKHVFMAWQEKKNLILVIYIFTYVVKCKVLETKLEARNKTNKLWYCLTTA